MRLLKRRLIEILFFVVIISFFGLLAVCLWLLSTFGSPAANYIGFSVILFCGGLILLLPFFQPHGHVGRFKAWSMKNNVLFKADWIWAPSAAAVGASAVGILIASRSTIVFFVATQGILTVQPNVTLNDIRSHYAYEFPSAYKIQSQMMMQQDYACGLAQQTCHLCLAPVTDGQAPFLFWTGCIVTDEECPESLAHAHEDSCLGSWSKFDPPAAIAADQNVQGINAIKATYGYDVILIQQSDVIAQYKTGLLELVLAISLYVIVISLAALLRRTLAYCLKCYPPIPLAPAPKPTPNAGRRR
jgi:hypothetical protein